MGLRKPTLDEWFNAYQLRELQKDGFFNPGMLELDISPVYKRHRAAGKRLSFPALVIKAYALAAREVPEINRAYLRTPWGERIADFDHVSVNVPIAMQENGRTYLSAIVVRNADQKSVSTISNEIDRARRRSIDETRLTKWVAKKPNRLIWRSLLKTMHFGAYRWPAWLASKGGGLSVSSLLDHKHQDSAFTAVSFGPTATTLLLSSIDANEAGECLLRLGVGLNHVAASGLAFRRLCDVLKDHLESADEQILALWD